jgi:hypothetical protein
MRTLRQPVLPRQQTHRIPSQQLLEQNGETEQVFCLIERLAFYMAL